MMMNRIEKYIKQTFPLWLYFDNWNVSATICNYPNVRFELGAPYRSGTDKRIKQVYHRSKSAISDIIFNADDEIYILVLDWPLESNNFFTNDLGHFFRQFDNRFIKFERNATDDSEDTTILKFIKLRWKDINYESVLEGIANLEQGRNPKTVQRVFFIDYKRNIGFYMYDDRGCLIWSIHPEIISSIYNKRKDWIIDHWFGGAYNDNGKNEPMPQSG